jgi:hypothetical protein
MLTIKNEKMKKSTLLLCTVLLSALTLTSFENAEENTYGGWASASGKVTYVTDYEKTQGRKVGDIELIEVTLECRGNNYTTKADVIARLKRDLDGKAATKHISLTTSVKYDVTSCD